MEHINLTNFYKGPVTSCEYLNEDILIIGCGPFLCIIDDPSLNEISRYVALKYRVIHKIVVNENNPKLICVFGQKSFNIISYNEKFELFSLIDNYVEMNDWIFDIYWLVSDSTKSDKSNILNKESFTLALICAHNQCIHFNLVKLQIEKLTYCDQKCMLYSAKILDVNNNKKFEQISVVSGTIYNQILIWNALNGKILVTLDGHQGVIFNIEYSYSNNYLFTTSDDRSINVWNLNIVNDKHYKSISSSSLWTRFYGHDARVWKCLCFILDDETSNQYLCSIGEDLNCCLWNVNKKILVYRFNVMHKGSKNIWSICFNKNKMNILTGWADGGLRKFELNNYLLSRPVQRQITYALSNEMLDTDSNQNNVELSNDHFEWCVIYENKKDFIRSILVIDGRILCSTNLGEIFLVDTNTKKSVENSQKLLLKSNLLSNYSVMSKVKNGQNWTVAIGTLKGFIYLLNLKISNHQEKTKKDEITIDCINCLRIEEELTETDASSKKNAITTASLQTTRSTKIFNLIWCRYQDPIQKTRYFLLACFTLINGLVHLYELDKSMQLKLKARLFLPNTKHRWFTSFSIISIVKTDEKTANEVINSRELIYLVGGDKSGNLHLFNIEIKYTKQTIQNETKDSNLKELNQSNHLSLTKPTQSIENFTKSNSSISAIYSKNLIDGPYKNETNSLKYLIICCCKDGFYRVLEFNSNFRNSRIPGDELHDPQKSSENEIFHNEFQKPFSSENHKNQYMLTLINTNKINSFVDIIEFFLFEEDNFDDDCESNSDPEMSFTSDRLIENMYNLENRLKIAFCFYGDKFILWNFHLNRPIFEFKCGGSNRSWDYEFLVRSPSSNLYNDEAKIFYRFFYIKNKNIGEARRLLNKNEIETPLNQNKNHISQMFHGNTITTCKYLNMAKKYLFTGSEDTMLILNRVDNADSNEDKINLVHQFHLQGHDSTVKCIDYCQIAPDELILVSAGAKANIKIWKIFLTSVTDDSVSLDKNINRITHLCDFRKFNVKSNLSKTGKSSLDLDIRFMDVNIFKMSESNQIVICFACSDGYIRIFEYILQTNKIYLINTFKYSHCLLCLRHLKIKDKNYLLSFGTDGSLTFWKLNLTDEEKPQKIPNLHQSGINSVDLWIGSNIDQIFLVSVGDDTRINVSEISIDDEQKINIDSSIKQDMAHASSISGVKFLNQEYIVSVSKDQRLILWKIDYKYKKIKPEKVIFTNVADVSSIDIVKLEKSNIFRVAIVGVGIEIINLKLH